MRTLTACKSVPDRGATSLTVITPTYNRSAFLRTCVLSVLRQRGLDIELIVVNDGSTDDTRSQLKGLMADYSNIVLVDCEANQGRSVSRNIGIEKATKEFLIFLDDDDYLVDSSSLAECVRQASESDIDMLYVPRVLAHESTGTHCGFIEKKKERNLARSLPAVDSLENCPEVFRAGSTTNFIYKTEFVQGNNIRFAPDLLRWEDRPFFTSGLVKAGCVGATDKFYYVIRKHGEGTMVRFHGRDKSSARTLNDLWMNVRHLEIVHNAFDCADRESSALSFGRRIMSRRSLRLIEERILPDIFFSSVPPEEYENVNRKIGEIASRFDISPSSLFREKRGRDRVFWGAVRVKLLSQLRARKLSSASQTFARAHEISRIMSIHSGWFRYVRAGWHIGNRWFHEKLRKRC